MTSANGWFGKIKSRVQSVQETAKIQIEKYTETLDKKLKEAEEDLKKQRSKVEAPEPGLLQQQQIWRPSVENPDGEILTIPKPPPPDVSTSFSPPNNPPVSTPTIEPLTIPHLKGRRRLPKKNGFVSTTCLPTDHEADSGAEHRNSYIRQSNNRKEIMLCLNDIITDIINREDVNTCLNDLIDIISTEVEFVENTTLIDVSKKEELISDQHSTNHFEQNTNDSIPHETESDIPTDELTLMTSIDHRSVERNVSENIQNDELTTLAYVDNAPIENIDSEDVLPTVKHVDDIHVKQVDLENLQIDTTEEDDLSTLLNVNDAGIEQLHSTNIQINVQDDELQSLTNVTNELSEQSDLENTPNDTMDDELLTLPNTDDTPMENANPENISTNITDDELSTLTNVDQPPFEQFNLNEMHPIISEDTIETPRNELEDSFDGFTIPNVSEHRLPEIHSEKTTDLADLRKFLSNIEDDVDEESLPSQENMKILDEVVYHSFEQLDSSSITEDIFPSTSTSISEITQDDIMNSSSVQHDSCSDELPINDMNETNLTEKKRFSTVNCCSIPSGIKISHMICSSTYIYICTNDRKIFYAKLNINHIDQPFKWQEHSDLAERLFVSVSNRTVWRLFNKRLYSSNDSIKFPPIGCQWNEIKIDNRSALLSMSINDQCGWYIKADGTLWLIRADDELHQPLNVACPFNLNKVLCFSEKVGVTTSDGEILIRVGCTNDCLEGDGWIFIPHNFGPIDDFVLLTNNNIIFIVDKKHRLWVYQWSSDRGFFEVLCNDNFIMSHQRYLTSVNSEILCLTDCEEQIHMFSDCLTGIRWTRIEKNTRLQRLIGVFSNENYVWALTTDRMICSSNGQTLEKPRQAQYLTHATFVPDNSSQDTILWSLDESCNIYVRANVEINTQWEQLDQSQFEWNRRLVHIVCNNAGVWAVDDQGYIYFRHGHISASPHVYSNELSVLPPAWITIPGEASKYRYFSQVFCGPADWMVYATDNKQTVYARLGINEENRVGTSWKAIDDCSALELAISEYSLWLLTSCGEIQCRENISPTNPVGTRSTTLSGHFLSLTVSMDDSQVWALDSKRNLLKLDRLAVLFEK